MEANHKDITSHDNVMFCHLLQIQHIAEAQYVIHTTSVFVLNSSQLSVLSFLLKILTSFITNLCRFSSIATTDIHFGQFQTLTSFKAELDTQLPFIGENTYIHKGLRAAEREFDNADKKLPKVFS